MSTIPTPAQAAAARREKLAQDALRAADIADLKNRCVACIANYDGNDCVTLPLIGQDRDCVTAVESEMPGWSLYASNDGNLYLGEPLQTGLIRTRDSLFDAASDMLRPVNQPTPTSPPDDLLLQQAGTDSLTELTLSAPTPVLPATPPRPVQRTIFIDWYYKDRGRRFIVP